MSVWRVRPDPGPESAAHHELRVVYTVLRGAERYLLYGAYSRQKCDTEFAQHRFSDRPRQYARTACQAIFSSMQLRVIAWRAQ